MLVGVSCAQQIAREDEYGFDGSWRPREIKDNEYRVGVTPAGVLGLRAAGHRVKVHRSAATRVGFSDADMTQPGQSFVADASSEYAAQLVVKVKEMLLPPLSRLVMRRELATDYADIVPRLPADQWRRGRGEQETIVRFESDPPSKRCQLLDDNESDGA